MQSSFRHLPLAQIDWQCLAKTLSQSNRVQEKRGKYTASVPGYPKLPSSLSLRPYQQQAVTRWLQNRGRGTLKMATGSGKTITALAITTQLYEKIGLRVLLVICPYRHLVTQWARACKEFNLNPLLAFENVHNWQSELSIQLYNLQIQQRGFLTLITTNATFLTPGLQSQLRFFPEKTLIVGDEAHHLGSGRLRESLPSNVGLRLALSATPERYFDEDGTTDLYDYFGEVLQPEFTLADAIEQGALVHYRYYPLFVPLTAAEAFAYAKLTKRIGWVMGEDRNLDSNDNLKSLLMARSRLVGAASNKLNALRQLMSERLYTSHTLFYCGDGQVEHSQAYQRQLEAVTQILGKELGYRVNTYTAETPLAQRDAMQKQFESGQLQGLISIRCLDEGIDIPAIRNAVILASTSNPRQFIQRRGRILRPHPGKTQASLFDMIVLPPSLDRETWEVERSLLRKELERFLEFAELADNAQEAKMQFLDLQHQYQL